MVWSTEDIEPVVPMLGPDRVRLTLEERLSRLSAWHRQYSSGLTMTGQGRVPGVQNRRREQTAED